MYSHAQTLLLDDVLSALDVHTAKWIVEKCFQGDLLLGRTVLLVTHNVALVAPISGFAIELGSEGRIIRQGPLDDILRESSALQQEAEKDRAELEKNGENVEAAAAEKSTKGKLIVAEEIALGRVAWPALKLYTGEIGGPLFWTVFLAGLIASHFLSTVRIWFLGYWASQYNTHESGSVPVARWVTLFSP